MAKQCEFKRESERESMITSKYWFHRWTTYLEIRTRFEYVVDEHLRLRQGTVNYCRSCVDVLKHFKFRNISFFLRIFHHLPTDV